MLVFSTANEDWSPPPELRQFANAARDVFRKRGKDGDLLSPEAIQAYFGEVYWQKGMEALDARSLLALLKKSRLDTLPMETLAARFRMIETVQWPVIVPYDGKARAALKSLRFAEHAGGIARRLQPYLVQIPDAGFVALRTSGAIQAVAPEKWGEQFMELTNPSLYDSRVGLRWEGEIFLKPESLVW